MFGRFVALVATFATTSEQIHQSISTWQYFYYVLRNLVLASPVWYSVVHFSFPPSPSQCYVPPHMLTVQHAGSPTIHQLPEMYVAIEQERNRILGSYQFLCTCWLVFLQHQNTELRQSRCVLVDVVYQGCHIHHLFSFVASGQYIALASCSYFASKSYTSWIIIETLAFMS